MDAVTAYGTVLIATHDDDVEFLGLAERGRLILGTRSACARAGYDLTNVVEA